MAVLTNGELAIENDIFFASLSLEHFKELILINFEAPSPSLTTLFAKFNKTLFKAKSKSFNFISFILLIDLFFAFPVEKLLSYH